MARAYVPDRGDIVWLQFNPQAGHEQAGRRPALVISPKLYNKTVGLALFCPITSRVKGYPFEVLMPSGSKVKGAILSDQIKSLDWRVRNASRFSRASKEVMTEVLAKIFTLVGDSPEPAR
jgi:mRNA interferase MazF